MSYVTDLTDKGFDGSDVHWFSTYFKFGLKIRDPRFPDNDIQKELEASHKADLLAKNGSKEDIQKIIDAGRIGITYTEDVHNKLLTSK